jgi:hypothetical protein
VLRATGGSGTGGKMRWEDARSLEAYRDAPLTETGKSWHPYGGGRAFFFWDAIKCNRVARALCAVVFLSGTGSNEYLNTHTLLLADFAGSLCLLFALPTLAPPPHRQAPGSRAGRQARVLRLPAAAHPFVAAHAVPPDGGICLPGGVRAGARRTLARHLGLRSPDVPPAPRGSGLLGRRGATHRGGECVCARARAFKNLLVVCVSGTSGGGGACAGLLLLLSGSRRGLWLASSCCCHLSQNNDGGEKKYTLLLAQCGAARSWRSTRT